jgi:hypothetical protein
VVVAARGEHGGVTFDLAMRFQVVGAPQGPAIEVGGQAGAGARVASTPGARPFDAAFLIVTGALESPDEAGAASARALATRAIAAYHRGAGSRGTRAPTRS